MKRFFACVIMALSTAGATAADACIDNFKSEGSVSTGKTFRTFAILNGVPQADLFQRARSFVAANGFTVLSSDQSAGLISAAQTASRAQGESIPFGVVILQETGGMRISLSLETTGAAIMPEEAVREFFCKAIAAAVGSADKRS